MAQSFWSSQPRCTQGVVSVGNCIEKMQAFNSVFEANDDTTSARHLKDVQKQIMWQKAVRDGVILCGSDPMEIDFFEQIAGGPTKDVDAKELFIRTECDTDLNIFAAAAIQGAAPGAATTFQIHRGHYTADGKFSPLSEGQQIYIYEDRQWVFVESKNTAQDFGHTVTVIPFSKDYTVNIRSQRKMIVSRARMVNGMSCPVPATAVRETGYISSVQPFRIRMDYCVPIDIMRGFSEVLQFAIGFDEQGNEIDCWELYEKTQMRRDMKWAKNLMAFLGQKTDNPLLKNSKLSMGYSGFDGYFPTLQYGGGQVQDFDPVEGYDLDGEFGAIMLRNDSLKRTTEYVATAGMPFMMGMERASREVFKASTGQCTFDSFKRMGLNQDEIKRLGIKSYEFMGQTIHFNIMSALSDSRGIGNYNMPYTAMLMPGNGLKDSKGRAVPPIEFFQIKGSCGYSGSFEEHQRDMRKIDGCETIEGHMAETVMMAVHCPQQHILLNPVMPCI